MGGDSFTYTATDSSGNSSVPATVTVTIEKTKSGVTYADTTDCKAAAAAQHLAECEGKSRENNQALAKQENSPCLKKLPIMYKVTAAAIMANAVLLCMGTQN